jgi:hypothetical protein
LKAIDYGYSFSLSPFTGSLYSHILLIGRKFLNRPFDGGGFATRAKFAVDNALSRGLGVGIAIGF